MSPGGWGTLVPDEAVTFGDGPCEENAAGEATPQLIRDRHPVHSGAGPRMMETHHFSLRCAVVGRGRMGSALTAALGLGEPLGRGADAAHADVVLLAVPDAEIPSAPAAIAPGRLVGHLSGATTLAPLAPHDAFSLHPLMTVTGTETSFHGATAAVAGTTERALETARALAQHLAMRPFEVADADRAAYHA